MIHCTLQPIVMLNKTIGSKVQGILENFNVIGSYTLSNSGKTNIKEVINTCLGCRISWFGSPCTYMNLKLCAELLNYIQLNTLSNYTISCT